MNPSILICTLITVLATASPGSPDSSRSAHWAFQPIRKPEIPPVQNQAWIRTPIDAFILAKLERATLQPAAPAPPQTLARRLSYTLTGLPPGYADVQTFDPDTLIERMLASPHFGERWARHWLDVARYSDTKGYAYSPEEFTFVHAWLYRDWVVQAFNDDLPFDQFLIRQLAADRLLERGECDKSDLAAMGFLTLGRRFVGVEQDIIDDRIDTVTRGMLGLTVSCSRCHDHKYDPLPASDYYALYGIFDSSHEKMIALKACDDEVLRERHEKLAAEFDKHTATVEKRHLDRAAEYLIATLDMSKVPAPDFAEIVTADDLNPEQIRRWHEYLSLADKAGDPIVGAWKALAAIPPASDFAKEAASVLKNLPSACPLILDMLNATPLQNMEDVAVRYAQTLKANPDNPEIAELIAGPGSPIAIPRDRHLHDIEWLFADDERNSMKKMLAEIERRIFELGEDAPHAVIMADQPVPENMRILLRGDYATPGEEVPRRAPGILGGAEFSEGSGRLELAGTIAAGDNPLTARVIVNRLWQHHFGTGLVNTPSDFGLRCEAPSHPELLDFLAARLIDNGWSLKSIHRLILQSAVYQQASTPNPEAATLDPENRLLSHFPRRRLDFESMRDSLLAASGELDLTAGGKPGAMLGASATKRRSLYGRIDRQFLPNTLREFDFANPELHSPQRHLTNIPQQALFFMNSPFAEARAIAFANRVKGNGSEARIREFFQIAYQRDPSARELQVSLEFIEGAIEEDTAHELKPGPEEPSPWRYGYGRYDEATGRLEKFDLLPHFTGEAWGGSDNWPDAQLGWLRITATGGHTGNDLEHPAVRRWISPADCKISISGALQNDDDCGDGVRAIIISSRQGRLKQWVAKYGETIDASVGEIEIAEGETIDFIVDCGPSGNFQCDQFVWAPIIESDEGENWSAEEQFGGTVTRPKRQLDAWERLAHSLLLTNAFMYID